MSTPLPLAAAFAARAAERPSAPALVWEDRTIGYGELYAMACAARTQVEAAAPRPGRPVGLRVRKSPDSVALVLGCLMAGRSFLLPSHELPDLPLKELYAQAGCAVVLGLADDPLVDVVVDPSAVAPAGGPGRTRPPAGVADDDTGF
ncbi:AMP-binding protein, partial [Streptomyces sp. NPDC005009]